MGCGKAADGFVVLIEGLVGNAEDVVGVAVGGIGRHGLFEFDDGVAVAALLDQVVAGAKVVEGFGRLGEGGCAQKREGKTEQAAVLQSEISSYEEVKAWAGV